MQRVKNLFFILFSLFLVVSSLRVCYADMYSFPTPMPDIYKEYQAGLEKGEYIDFNDFIEKKAVEHNTTVEKYRDYVYYYRGNPRYLEYNTDGVFTFEEYLECVKLDSLEKNVISVVLLVFVMLWFFILFVVFRKIKVIKNMKKQDLNSLNIKE